MSDDKLTQEEFKQEANKSASIAVNRANEFLKKLGLSLSINWNYKFNGYYADAIGVYERDSVFEDNISIGINVNNLYEYFCDETSSYPYTNPYTIIDEALQTNVYHEMGHGIIELFNDYLQYSDDLDDLYDQNEQLFDWVLDNEEDAVEEFAWAFYDNQLDDSKLYKIIELYINKYNLQENKKSKKRIMINESQLQTIMKEFYKNK